MADLFPFRKTDHIPQYEGMTVEQACALPRDAKVTHVEWEEIMAFGKVRRRLCVWLLGCRKPLKWKAYSWMRDEGGYWV